MSRHNILAMSERYINHYRILGLPPEAGWLELRQAYKTLVNIWHPDRFQQDASQQKLAEDKTKEITQCYHELAQYYKKYGALPRMLDRSQITAPEDTTPPAEDFPDVQSESETQDASPALDEVTQPPEPGGRPKFASRAMAAGILSFIVYFIAQTMQTDGPQEQHRDKNRMEQTEKMQNDADSNPPVASEPAVNADNGKFFTVGTSLREVQTIQGIPTKTEPDIWYYGDSKVYFANGKVVRWAESPSHPLRAELDPEVNKTRMEIFGKGSTKKQVLAIQGPPDRDTGDVWDYGVSRVYFDNGRVKGWDESPFNPLKVHQ